MTELNIANLLYFNIVTQKFYLSIKISIILIKKIFFIFFTIGKMNDYRFFLTTRSNFNKNMKVLI